MKAKYLYSEEGEFYDYHPIIEGLTDDGVIIQVNDLSYSGDTRVFFVNGWNKYGHLVIGWGSCSGCDALQACSTYEDVDKLIEKLRNSIVWFDNEESALKYFIEHDWGGDYDQSPEMLAYRAAVETYLKGKRNER